MRQLKQAAYGFLIGVGIGFAIITVMDAIDGRFEMKNLTVVLVCAAGIIDHNIREE